ncbi:hypothetical protein BGX26_005784 [Mortierella sp. AD094]|nr:hypothetical protein BGX26_005784 [Mortierella sp. AD094]
MDDVLIRHQLYVRSLHSVEPLNAVTKNLCPNLRSTHYSLHRDESNSVLGMLGIASQAPLLQTLSIRHINTVSRELLDELSNLLKSLSHLKMLDLEFSYRINPGTTKRIFEISRHCESLHLSYGDIKPIRSPSDAAEGKEPQYRLQTVKDAMDRMEGIQFRDLAIGIPGSVQESVILIPLLERCHFLERLDLIEVQNHDTMVQVARILGSKTRPRLKCLQIGQIPCNGIDYSILLRAVGCQGIGARNDGDPMDEGGLQTLAFGWSACFDARMVAIAPQYVSNTLTSLDLGNRKISWTVLVYLTSRLSKLRSLVALIPKGVESDSLHYRRYQEGTSGNRAMEYIFSQIGKFTELEEWRLQSLIPLMDLTNGFLGPLAELKKLERLSLQSYISYVKFKSEDMKWMLEHWPRLRYFEVRVGRIPAWHPDSSNPPKNPVIEELRVGRLWLEIDADRMVL